MHTIKTLSRHSLRTAKKLERSIKQAKIERGFSRTTESFAEAVALAKEARSTQASTVVLIPFERQLPKVAHFIVERNASMRSVMAVLAHHKEETGAVPVIHVRSRRTESIAMPSCLGVFGHIIDSSVV